MGDVEGLLLSFVVIYLVTGYFGQEIWTTKLPIGDNIPENFKNLLENSEFGRNYILYPFLT